MMATLAAAAFIATPAALQSNDLRTVCTDAVKAALSRFKDKDLKMEQLGLSVAVLDRSMGSYTTGDFRGDQAMYPASVVKLFYLANAAQQLEDKRLTLTPEFERAIRDMIVDSSNDATGLVLEMLTGTTGGPELSPRELEKWMHKRREVNRWFESMGYTKVNANQKTWNEGPYGRERQGYGPNWEYRNSLTPDSCTRLMAEIALDRIVTADKCAWMKSYLSRKPVSEEKETDYQSRGFTGQILPKGFQLWSKAGYTSTVRHDVAYVKAPDGREAVVTVFTKDHSTNAELVPFLAAEVLKGLKLW